MKSLLAIIGGLFVLGFTAQAGETCKACTTHPASPCQPVVAHLVHCHTTTCSNPCGYVCGNPCASPCGVYAYPYVRVANRPYCRPLVRVNVRRGCLPRTIYYRTCYSACGW